MKVSGSPFLEACNRKDTEYTPVWFMRQAGRYLPSYRRIKGSRQVLDLAKDPELASEVAVDAVKSLGVDAGIMFADIMLPLEAMGVRFSIEENSGPVVSNPIRTVEDVNSLRNLDPKTDVPYVYDGIEKTIEKLDGSVPLIGFSGAPFTLAAYIIEGGPSRDLEMTKTLMFSKPDLWNILMRKLTDMVKSYLAEQVRHGVAAVQLFDSWVGCLSPSDYKNYVSGYTKAIIGSLNGVPRIHFCANSSSLIEQFVDVGPDVLSVDWRIQISNAWQRTRDSIGIQGNLDPSLASADGDPMRREVAGILAQSNGHMGHIFSLGHGVLRETPPENLREIVRTVHDTTRRRG